MDRDRKYRKYVVEYTAPQRTVLAFRPGITSPASLAFIDEQESTGALLDTRPLYYREVILPRKLELDLSYCQHVSLLVDAQLIVRTALRLVLPPHFQRRRKIRFMSALGYGLSLLAIGGGAPVTTTPPGKWPQLSDDEIEVAAAVLRSGNLNYWTGKQGGLFEQEFASFSGCQHAVAVANGTVALDAALHALCIGPGDEVVVASRTFIASASSIVFRGGTPRFADVDRDSQNITAKAIEKVLSSRTKAIIAVHLAGWPCDMDPILSLARDHGLTVIEDCAQAHAARYKGRQVGSMGDIAVFSFCQDKIMSTGGEGGMVTTNNHDLWHRIWSFKDHGKDFHAMQQRHHGLDRRWVHKSIGSNYRLTEMQSALGRMLLIKVPEWVTQRRDNARILTDCFSRIPALRVTRPSEDFRHSYYKYYAFVRPENLASGWTRGKVLEAISAEGVPCQAGICSEVYLEEAFSPQFQPVSRLPVAYELGETSLSFSCTRRLRWKTFTILVGRSRK